jgi:hypothetical protein
MMLSPNSLVSCSSKEKTFMPWSGPGAQWAQSSTQEPQLHNLRVQPPLNKSCVCPFPAGDPSNPVIPPQFQITDSTIFPQFFLSLRPVFLDSQNSMATHHVTQIHCPSSIAHASWSLPLLHMACFAASFPSPLHLYCTSVQAELAPLLCTHSQFSDYSLSLGSSRTRSSKHASGESNQQERGLL